MKNSFRNFSSIIKKYQWKSLFFVYLKQILAIILIPAIMLFVITFSYRVNMMKKEFSTLTRTSLEKTSVLLDNVTKSIDNIYNVVFSNSYAKSFFLADLEHTKGFEINNIAKKVTNIFETYLHIFPYIKSIYVYNIKSDYVISNIHHGKTENFIDTSWYEIYKETGNCHFIYPTEYTHSDEKTSQISFSYPIKYGTALDGILVINLNIAALDTLLTSNPDESLYILYEDTVIYSTNHTLIGTPASDSKDISRFLNQKNTSKIKFDHAWSLVENTDYNLTLISNIHSESFSKSFGSLFYSYILILLVILILAILYSMYNAYKFYYYIADIIVQLPDSGIIPDVTAEKPSNELASIRNSLIAMINKTENIEKNLSEKMVSLKTAQTIALQSQINPHFIFNTLNLINLTIIDSYGMNHKAIRIIELFSKILSGIFSSNNYLISVKEELDYAKKFLEIEKIKTDNNLTIHWDIDETIYRKKTLKMILQPIIENAVEHGIKPRFDQKGELTIKAFCENNETVFIISDNGVGISEAKLYELQEKMKHLDISDCKHLGIKNVHLRINILYGEHFGIKIKSTPKAGTTIMITQPEEEI